MTVFRTLIAAVAAAVLAYAPAIAGPRHDGPQQSWQDRNDSPRGWPQRGSDRAFLDVQQGRAMPLPQLERRVMPQMPGAEYLGPELNRGTYRLKFMQNGRVIWVDVDSQTGRIIRRSH